MPLYDFRCTACENRFEAQVPYGELPPCPECAAAETERLMSPVAGPFTIRPRGLAARRADAERLTRETQRLERKANRIEQRKQES